MTRSKQDTATPCDERRWQAVMTRDRAADGSFVYAVGSTGIYCRPSCPSRRPSRRNVTFHDSTSDAESAGFRACFKCRGQPQDDENPMLQVVQRACRIIEAAEDRAPTLEALATTTAMGKHRLYRAFRSVMGITPHDYWDSLRLTRLRQDLKNGETVSSALYGAGYNSASRLYEGAHDRLGMTPASYGRGGAGTVIAHSLRSGPLGLVLAAATANGVCFVALGDDEAALTASLRQEFPKAVHHRDDSGLGDMLDQVIRHLDGRVPQIGLPLDIRATAFQRQVWQALSNIPYGETRSYGEIAASIGRPGASRAVGHACARNPVALLLPCHRVISAGGDVSGYRWGRRRKRRLIAQEQERSGSRHPGRD